jgi:hypothetical protein
MLRISKQRAITEGAMTPETRLVGQFLLLLVLKSQSLLQEDNPLT